MDKLKMQSPNLVDANIEKIAEMFPNCITEAKDENGILRRVVDFDLLRQELSANLVEGPQERYTLSWPGKNEAILTANAPIAKTLRPCEEESVDFENTKNLYIEGDNLDVLKLLQETYLNSVNMIYIDQPYNTGNDFIYKDDFAEDTETFLKRSNQKDEVGNRLVANTESNGRFHSDWLTMIYPRVKLARNLLSDDGIFFTSIGNAEVTNMRRLCDEIFGEKNFIECVTWNKRIPKNDKGVGNIHEFILIYAKDASLKHEFLMRKEGLEDIEELVEKLKKTKMPLVDAEKEIKKLYKKQGYDRGITLYNSLSYDYRLWGKINMSWPNANTFGPRYEVKHPITGNPVAIPDRGWRWKQDTFCDAAIIKDGRYQSVEKLHDGSVMCGRVWFGPNENLQPSSVTYLDEVHTFLLRSILSFKSDGGIEVENLFDGKNYFSYPKPTTLIKTLLGAIHLNDGDIVLDFFSGSATTADATMQLNAEDGGTRKFIMVQLPEPCDENSEAFKAGYKTIAEIGKERIRRAGKKIKEEWEAKEPTLLDTASAENTIDIGFRVFKVDTSNMKDVYYTPDELKQANLELFKDHIKPDRNPEDLLFQVILDWGLYDGLSLPIAKETIDGKTVFVVDTNALLACFDSGITEELVKKLAKHKPLRAVFRDDAFGSDSVKINVEQIFKLLSPATEVKSI
jgi:adenine-specific DNA-methyltransferase